MESVDWSEVLRDGKARRANFSDLDAIIGINNDVYNGFDYMPAMFYNFMHSKRHAVYVYEVNGRVIALTNFLFYPEADNIINTMSTRVHPSFQGYGFSRPDRNGILYQLLKDYPKLSRSLMDAMLTPKVEALIKQLDPPLHTWNLLLYKIPDHRLITSLPSLHIGPTKPNCLSYADAIDWLSRNDELVEFLSRYSKDFIPVGHGWIPTPINKSGLRQIFSLSNTMISYSNPIADITANSVTSESKAEAISSGFIYGGQDRKNDLQTPKGSGNEIAGLSYSSCIQCKYGLSVIVFFYGDNEDIFLSHIYSQLRHYVGINKDGVRIGYHLNFPVNIDWNRIVERLKSVIGDRVDTGHFKTKQAILYSMPLPSLPSKI